MTVIWTAQEAAKATGGKAQGHWQVSSVVIDSRQAGPGDLFVALKGEYADGHDFVKDVINAGAVAMVNHIPKGVPEHAPLLLVRDCVQALTDLGAFNRRRSHARIIAVTGSVGKTSTKEALNHAFSALGKVHSSAGNYNNHLGVPISLARMPLNTDFGIFEIGMNHAGEIAALARQVRPLVAIITTVEAVHLEFFPSVKAIADAKAEIFLGLDPEGAAVLNSDNAYFDRLRHHATQAGVKRIISFGTGEAAMCRLVEYRQEAEGSYVRASIAGMDIVYALQARGIHHALNSVAALAAVYALGEDVATAAGAMAQFGTPHGRGNHITLTMGGNIFTVIDDSYNASPVSMKAALTMLREAKGRKLAILGDMLELGDSAPQLHHALLEAIITNSIDKVMTVGTQMEHLHNALPVALRLGHYPDATSAGNALSDLIQAGDTILIKGSHGTGMFRLVEQLKNSQELPGVAQ